MRLLISSALLFCSIYPLISATAAESSAPVEIKEWPVPWEDTRPRDPYVDNSGKVWFVGQTGDYVAYLVPDSGEFKSYALEAGTGPHNLIVADDGFVWYAGNRAAHIGKLDPADGSIEKFPMPDPRARDPHTLVFDHDGNIWFTVQGGNFVGKLFTATGDVHLIEVSTRNARPYGIVVDQNNRPWIAEFASNKLATVDPDTMQLTEYPLPRSDTRPRRLDVSSDGALWYVDFVGGYLGRFDPGDGLVQEWQAPAERSSGPYGMAIDGQDRIWFVESGIRPNRFVGFDPTSETFFSQTEIPSGGGTVRHMFYHSPTEAIWFGADTNTVGRALMP